MAGSKVADSSPFLHIGRPNSLYNRRESCVICVGSTGAGKSSNIAIFTGNPVITILSCVFSVFELYHTYPLFTRPVLCWNH
jgi:predicted GTPase